LSSCAVLHFWNVSYRLGAPFMEAKHDQGRQLLELYRRNEIPDFDGDDWMTPEYLAWVKHREGYLSPPVLSRPGR
jgi:hypothetical protein